jgi:hypothetical protein
MLVLGALAPTNPVGHPEAKALEATLGVYRFDPFESHELDIGNYSRLRARPASS